MSGRPAAERPDDAGHTAVAVDAAELSSVVDGVLRRRPAVGLALGVVVDGRLRALHTDGVADMASGSPITEHTVFRIASITKTFTALAVMQLSERGLVDLDAPANDYLRRPTGLLESAHRGPQDATDHQRPSRPTTIRGSVLGRDALYRS